MRRHLLAFYKVTKFIAWQCPFNRGDPFPSINYGQTERDKKFLICIITKRMMEVRFLRKVIDTFFFSQTGSDHKALFFSLPKFHADIEIHAVKRIRLSICQVSEYGYECGGRNSKFSDTWLGASRSHQCLGWGSFEMSHYALSVELSK